MNNEPAIPASIEQDSFERFIVGKNIITAFTCLDLDKNLAMIWYTPKRCTKCGHLPCPGCGDWCDVILYRSTDDGNHQPDPEDPYDDDDYPRPCCDMKCTYENAND